MTVLSDKMVVDAQDALFADVKDERRRMTVHFEQQAREIVPVVVRREAVSLNPLARALEGLKQELREAMEQ